jgi:hypothetical protein
MATTTNESNSDFLDELNVYVYKRSFTCDVDINRNFKIYLNRVYKNILLKRDNAELSKHSCFRKKLMKGIADSMVNNETSIICLSSDDLEILENSIKQINPLQTLDDINEFQKKLSEKIIYNSRNYIMKRLFPDQIILPDGNHCDITIIPNNIVDNVQNYCIYLKYKK